MRIVEHLHSFNLYTAFINQQRPKDIESKSDTKI